MWLHENLKYVSYIIVFLLEGTDLDHGFVRICLVEENVIKIPFAQLIHILFKISNVTGLLLFHDSPKMLGNIFLSETVRK